MIAYVFCSVCKSKRHVLGDLLAVLPKDVTCKPLVYYVEQKLHPQGTAGFGSHLSSGSVYWFQGEEQFSYCFASGYYSFVDFSFFFSAVISFGANTVCTAVSTKEQGR